MNARFDYLVRLGDTSLVLGQRLAEWIGHSPALEEDLGLANISLDLLGQARWLLSYAGEVEGRGRSEDDLAFLRDEPDFRNLTLTELPNGDFAHTLVRQFLVDAWQAVLYANLERSTDERLAAIAMKAGKETRYHLRYSSDWVVRLGDGTAESHARTQNALNVLWRYTSEMFEADAIDRQAVLDGVAPEPAALAAEWAERVESVLREATLTVPARQPYAWHGKRGQHSEHLGYLLAEMQHLPRTYPGARW